MTQSETMDYHKRDDIDWTIECKRCEGTGRMICKTTTVVEPFKPIKLTSRDEALREYYEKRSK